MSLAWECTVEDVQNVLNTHNIVLTGEKVEELCEKLDHEAIEKAALNGNGMDEQSEYANAEVERQLVAAGNITDGKTLWGNQLTNAQVVEIRAKGYEPGESVPFGESLHDIGDDDEVDEGDTLLFSVVNPNSDLTETVVVEYADMGGYDGVPAKPVTVSLGGKRITIQPQQLMELGSLFIALAGVEGIDFDSADELLDGYCVKGREAAEKLAEALSE